MQLKSSWGDRILTKVNFSEYLIVFAVCCDLNCVSGGKNWYSIDRSWTRCCRWSESCTKCMIKPGRIFLRRKMRQRTQSRDWTFGSVWMGYSRGGSHSWKFWTLYDVIGPRILFEWPLVLLVDGAVWGDQCLQCVWDRGAESILQCMHGHSMGSTSKHILMMHHLRCINFIHTNCAYPAKG